MLELHLLFMVAGLGAGVEDVGGVGQSLRYPSSRFKADWLVRGRHDARMLT